MQDISKVREDRIILGTQCKEIRHDNEALQTQNASLRDSIHTQEMRIAEASAKVRDQDDRMKALGADIISAREDSRHLLSQLERQSNENDAARKDQFAKEEQLASKKLECKHALGEQRGEEGNRSDLQSQAKQLQDEIEALEVRENHLRTQSNYL